MNKNPSHDEITRRMLSIMNNIKPKLNEDTVSYPNFAEDVSTDITEIKEALQGYVIEINPQSYKNYNNTNIMMTGKTVIKSLPITFSYSLDENGVQILLPENSQAFPLYNEIIEFFVKLKANYDQWKNKWTGLLNDTTQATDNQ